MKIIKILFSVLIAAVITSCGISDEKASLEFGLKVGETYQIEITRDIKNYEDVNGEISDINQLLIVGYSFEPTSISNDGLVSLNGKIFSLKITQQGHLGSIEYDSNKDTLDIPILSKPYAALIGNTFKMQVLRDGTVKKVEGMNGNLEKILREMEIFQPEVFSKIKESLYDEFDDEILLETFERMFAFYPSNPVDINDSWEKTVKLSNYAPLNVKNSYSLLERNNGVAVISVNSEISTDTTTIGRRKKNDQYLRGKQNGKLQIDEISGWIRKAAFNYELHDATPKSRILENSSTKLLSSEIKISYNPVSGDSFKKIAFVPEAVVKGDGIGMTIAGMVVVFSSLILLFIVFSNTQKVLDLFSGAKKVKNVKSDDVKKKDDLTGEVNAAIATALYFYFQEAHDFENTVLTINRVSRTYSPWSSKIYGLRQYPRQK